MKYRRLTAAAAAAAITALAAGCAGSSASSAFSTAPAPAPSAPAPSVTLDYADAGRACAALNALLNPLTGTDSKAQAYGTVGQALQLSPAQVTAAVRERCPTL